LILETGWLLIGHVDEFVQFLPYDNDLGFTISIADTRSALDLLNKTQASGHGSVRPISYEGPMTEVGLNSTIDEILANSTFLEVNSYAQKHIDANLQALLGEIPLDAKDVIYVPTLFRAADIWDFTEGDGLPPHPDAIRSGEWETVALHLASINGIVIGRSYISPRPFGPVGDRVDLLTQAVQAAYACASMYVPYVDDFESYHVAAGEVHCGSNTLRQTDLVWWE
jgi:protein-arginine deiminase